VPLRRFLEQLSQRLQHREPASLDITPAVKQCVHRASVPWQPQPNAPLKFARVFDRLAHFVPPKSVVVVDTGSAMFGAAETLLPDGCSFVGQLFYGAIGYSVGAALGCAMAAPERPVLLIVGDGAFQIAAQELSTLIHRRPARTTVLLLNNDGYTIERFIKDGPFNNIARWRYHLLPEVFGGKRGSECRTEEELDRALRTAAAEQSALAFVEVHTDAWDAPKNMIAASEGMRQQLGSGLVPDQKKEKAAATTTVG